MPAIRTWGTATVLVAALLTLLSLPLTGFSSATFTGQTRTTASVAAAADWTPPTVTMTDPGAVVQGTVTLAAQASDEESGVASVAIQYLLVGTAGWTTLCTDTVAPYTCGWNTSGVMDGEYALRAVATDKAGYETVSAPVSTTVANSMVVLLADPGNAVRGTVPLSVRLANPGPVLWSVRVEYVEAGGNGWKTACTSTASASPYTCSWNTAALANGDYEIRGVATAAGNVTRYSTVREVTVDNLPPSVIMTDPGTPLRGTVVLSATATDAHAGVAQVTIQQQRSGAASWTDVCTTVEPYRCSLDTTRLADGTYSFRATAVDGAGNTTTSTAVTNRVIDNTVSAVSLDDPGADLAGTVTLTANASSTAGVTQVVIQRTASGGSVWADICAVTSTPYSCSWDTTTVTDGRYDLRAVLTDGNDGVTTSAVVSARRVDNSPLRGADVQAANGGGTVGRLEAGDTLTFTYTSLVQLASVTPGWSGAALPVTLRLRDGSVIGLGGNDDSIDVLRSGAAVNLGTTNLRQDYVRQGRTVTFHATMTASTVTVAGEQRTRVTITAGTLDSGKGLRTVSTAAAMVWTPSGAVVDLQGNVCATAPVVETGAPDREF